jgi:uncharacterized protein with FMN-binding domain
VARSEAETQAVSLPPVVAAPAAPIKVQQVATEPAAPAPAEASAAAVPAAPETKPEIRTEVAVVKPPEPPAPKAPEPAPLPAPAPAPAAVPAPPAQPTWKDGTYSGWSSSRHGSIQASVVIADGRISSARIEQCQMRYPCYVIDRLVPQVAQRGHPEKIDRISGATESSDVFYWALMYALAKSK